MRLTQSSGRRLHGAIALFAMLVSLPASAMADCSALPHRAANGSGVAARDSDGDGVPDGRDRCRAALPGASESDSHGCPRSADHTAGLSFHDTTHKGWYQRFWTGDCSGIADNRRERSTCDFVKIFNSENWLETIEIVTERIGAAERPVIRFDLWRLGRLVGFEWARNNDVRAIDTDDIGGWGKRLREAAPDRVCAEIDTLFKEVAEKLGSR